MGMLCRAWVRRQVRYRVGMKRSSGRVAGWERRWVKARSREMAVVNEARMRQRRRWSCDDFRWAICWGGRAGLGGVDIVAKKFY